MKSNHRNHLDKSLADAEQNALKSLEQELGRHALVTELTFNTTNMIASRLPELPVREVSSSRKVCTALLIRLSNDLRCAALLALRGYAVQAASLVLSNK